MVCLEEKIINASKKDCIMFLFKNKQNFVRGLIIKSKLHSPLLKDA